MWKHCVITAFLLASVFLAKAQSLFEERTVNIGNIGLNVSNVGTVGEPNVRSNPQGPPSMEYPLNSGIEHLFEGGLWIGAIQDGQVKVSTGAIDDASGYSTGKAGYELTSSSGISERSSNPASQNFSTQAVSQQDYLVNFTDKNTIVPGTSVVIQQHIAPLGADVHMESYAYDYSFADYFVILNYKVTNNSVNKWDSLYLGIWADLVVRNVNVTNESGANFFNKGGIGYLDSLKAVYAFNAASSADDYLYAQSFGAMQY